MGTNCAPLVVDLFLFCYERDFMMSLSGDKQAERVIVDGHGCHTALHFGVKAKEKKFLRCTGYLNSIKNPIKQDLLLILVLVR